MSLTAGLLCGSPPAEGGLLTAVGPTTVRALEVAVEPGSVPLRSGGGGGGLLGLQSSRSSVSQSRDFSFMFETYSQPGVRLRSSMAMFPC